MIVAYSTDNLAIGFRQLCPFAANNGFAACRIFSFTELGFPAFLLLEGNFSLKWLAPLARVWEFDEA